MFTRFQLCSATVGLSIVLTMATKSAGAVDPNQPASSYIQTIFTVEDGLSSNVVNAIVQTRNGFLWIGTDAGLNRFDGRHFTPIYFRGPKSTPQGNVSARAEGPEGDLWIGTSAGLVRIPRLALDRFDRSLSVFYHPGAGLSDEITWLRFSRDGALYRYMSLGEDSSGDLYALSAPKGIDRIEGNQLVEVNHDLDLLSMATSQRGELWFTDGKDL
jgi:streptogramin lyase